MYDQFVDPMKNSLQNHHSVTKTIHESAYFDPKNPPKSIPKTN